MSSKITRIFVYGSLRSGFKAPAYSYISQYFSLITPARVKGLLYDMGQYPAAVPVTEEHFIIGELYDIKNAHEFSFAIGQLDDYEGVYNEEGEPALYQRTITDVYLPDGTTTQAWVYWFNGDVTGKPAIAGGDMLEYVKFKTS